MHKLHVTFGFQYVHVYKMLSGIQSDIMGPYML